MRFLGIFFKYLLWSLFSIIVFLLLVGLAKTNRDMGAYIHFLDTTDWTVFHISQPATWVDPFWPMIDTEVSIDDMLSDEELSAEFSSGLDAYDPTFEDDLTTLPQDSVSDQEDDFGFTTDAAPSHESPDEDSVLREFVEQRSK